MQEAEVAQEAKVEHGTEVAAASPEIAAAGGSTPVPELRNLEASLAMKDWTAPEEGPKWAINADLALHLVSTNSLTVRAAVDDELFPKVYGITTPRDSLQLLASMSTPHNSPRGSPEESQASWPRPSTPSSPHQ